jgi:hypothetical protein
MEHYCIRKIKMFSPEWEILDQLAVELSAHARSGTANLVPSWTALIRGIVRGEYIVTPAKPNQHLSRIDEAIAANDAIEAAVANEERQREQARLDEQRRRIEAHTEQKQAVEKKPVKLTQLPMELEPA